MSDGLPGARILEDGTLGAVDHSAIAIPKGRDTAHEAIQLFVEDVQKSGRLARAIEQAGLRGSIPAEKVAP